jgi:S1-C subfamily serine protease
VQIMAVRGDDPQRVQVKDLGARPAARVMDVLDDSAAAKAGVQPGDLILSLAGRRSRTFRPSPRRWQTNPVRPS